MHLSEARRVLPRVASVVLVSAAVGVLSVPAARSASPAVPSRPAARTLPTDLYRGQQWTLDALHIPRAWTYSRGNGVTVAVLDTGVDGQQPDLTGHVIDGPDFTGQARKPGNKYWGRHGTEMASLIAGHGHGPGGSAGVMGVAPDAKILSIRVTWELDDPIRTDHTQVDHARDAVAEGIRYAADHGAQVISMSLGGGNLFYNGNASEEAAIKYAIGKGAVLIASAGNDGNGANRRNYPAAYPGVIAVGAVDRSFKAAKFTNRHTYISVAAPGVEIVSADTSGHGYILGTGTSSSAAFVAGMGALVKARYPSLTPEEIKQSLEEGATHRPPDGRSPETGAGVVDADGALQTAARINKAEHGGATVDQPQQTTQPSGRSSKPDLLLIAVLSGGGTLILLSLILGWRTRRRRAAAEARRVTFEEPAELPVPAARTASRSEPPPWDRRPGEAPPRRSPAPQPTSSGRSPWERRPQEAQGDDDLWKLGSRGPAPSSTGPFPSSTDPAPSSTGQWDQRRLPGAPAEPSWGQPADPAEFPSATGRHRSEPPGRSAGDDGEASSPGSSWDRPAAEPSGRRPTDPPGAVPAEPPESAWERFAPSQWDQPPAEPAQWDQSPAEPAQWDRPPAESSRWDDLPAEPLTWGDSSPEAPRWDDSPVETPEFPSTDETFPAEPSPSDSGWRDPQAEPPAASASGSGTRSLFDAMERFAASPNEDGPHEAPERRDEAPDSSDPLTTLPDSGSNASLSSASQDFRVAGGSEPDPLTDDRIDSSASDVGTPLADQSWDSIRRSFDQLKDASNWESLAKGEFQDPGELPGAFDETAALPAIDPDADDGHGGKR